ncbi:hypothetical protein OG921_17675 [Aldersonia sp. NBC_00410]|uniref:hypothetical protein n=1 Tax=Aldersonia sp. NBC_00410 TaxID=2975954 RepID=UPI002255BE32|nr:hypothetical protein [Aldersonia sp. NBC_00410]MCX5045001.1 hypothetical protein [Aldersonia sp. NBC_00410]
MSVSLPRRPIPDHVLADLHAHNLPSEVEQELWPLVKADPDALRLLDALDDVSERLRHIDDDDDVAPAPADIVARLDSILEMCTGDQLAYARSTRKNPPGRPSRRWAIGAAAAAAVLIPLIVTVGVLSTGSEHDPAPIIAAPPAGTATPALSHETMLAALGRNTVAGRLGDRTTLAGCLGAAGESGAVLGSIDTDYQGRAGVLVLVGGIRSGSITALILDNECSANDPRVLARSELR